MRMRKYQKPDEKKKKFNCKKKIPCDVELIIKESTESNGCHFVCSVEV